MSLPESFYRSLLSNEGMRLARAAMVSRSPWFLHDTLFSNLPAIRADGLLPRQPDGFMQCHLPSEATSVIGKGAGKLLCLAPTSATTKVCLGKEGLKCRIAVAGTNLPEQLGPDWSFPNQIDIAAAILACDPCLSCEEVFAEAVMRTSSLAVYAPISPDMLRIQAEGSAGNDPTAWPYIQDVVDDEIYTW